MAKFCRFCGSALVDGQPCTCPEAQAALNPSGTLPPQTPPMQDTQPFMQPQSSVPSQPAPTQIPPAFVPPQVPQTFAPSQPTPMQTPQNVVPPQAAPAVPSPLAIALQGILPFCKTYFRTPLSATRVLLEQRNALMAFLLLVLHALIGGLFCYGVLSSLCKSIHQLSLTLFQAIAGGNSAHATPFHLAAAFKNTFFAGTALTALCFLIVLVISFIVLKLMHSPHTFQETFIVYGSNTILPSALLLLAFVATFASLKIAFALLLLTVIVSFIMYANATQLLLSTSDNGNFWCINAVGIVLTLLLCLGATKALVPKFAISAGGFGQEHTFTIAELQSKLPQTSDVEEYLGQLSNVVEEVLDSQGLN